VPPCHASAGLQLERAYGCVFAFPVAILLQWPLTQAVANLLCCLDDWSPEVALDIHKTPAATQHSNSHERDWATHLQVGDAAEKAGSGASHVVLSRAIRRWDGAQLPHQLVPYARPQGLLLLASTPVSNTDSRAPAASRHACLQHWLQTPTCRHGRKLAPAREASLMDAARSPPQPGCSSRLPVCRCNR